MFFECLRFQPRLLRRKGDRDATCQSLWTSRFAERASERQVISLKKLSKSKGIRIEVIRLSLESYFFHRPFIA
jgi:hypothetical protein